MIKLISDSEKQLWREAAITALRTVENVSSKDDTKALTFATAVADGLILAYRKRMEAQ